MTYENFSKIILGLQTTHDRVGELYKLKVDLTDFVNSYQEIITRTLYEIYTEAGMEWLEWFMYENDFGRKVWDAPLYKNIDGKMIMVDSTETRPGYGAKDVNGNPICYDIKSTYEYITKYRK